MTALAPSLGARHFHEPIHFIVNRAFGARMSEGVTRDMGLLAAQIACAVPVASGVSRNERRACWVRAVHPFH